VDYQIELINPQGNINPVSGSAVAIPLGSTSIFGILSTPPTNYGNLKITLNGLANNLVLSPCIVGAEYEVTIVLTGTGLAAGITISGIAGGNTVNQFNGQSNTANTQNVHVYTFVATATVATLGYNSVTGSTYTSTFITVLPVPIGGL
jgi:hypothetical protein